MTGEAGTGAGKTAASARPKKDKPASYTAVVYFHGMGSQRRYEETSFLVDQIDRYLGNQERAGNPLGQLRGIEPCVEPLGGKNGQPGTVSYIKAELTAAAPTTDNGRIRFYEVYWAPVMAEQRSAWGVLKWIFRQPLRPFKTLNSPWRERQRLRRAALVAMLEAEHATATPDEIEDYLDLLEAYDEFEGPAQQRRFPAGSFDEFLLFIGDRPSVTPEAAIRRRALARRWLDAYRQGEMRNAALLATMALAVLLIAGWVPALVLGALKCLLAWAPLAGLLQQWDLSLTATWQTAIGIAVFLAGALGITRFLTDYMGDVEAWATYEETDTKHMARSKVLDRSVELMTHVLGDADCTRVAVVAHSLGTSVAHDALLALRRCNLAHNPASPMTGAVDLRKLEHVVTMGSPIDKIEYFFESYVSNSHRYKRVVEKLRGDIGSEPFSLNRKPYVHWINFWDQGDPISGPLHSPASATSFRQHVDNIHVASYRFPAPGASHAGYFGHRTVIDCLFRVICQRAASFRTLKQPAPAQPYNYASVYLGPGEPTGTRLPFVWMALAAPWLALIFTFGVLLKATALAFASGLAALTLIALLAIGYAAGRGAGHRKPL
jgi:hypothetical protein